MYKVPKKRFLMKILKFNEKFDYKNSDYKEYDEYSVIDIDILNEWKNDLDSVERYFEDLTHDIHQHNDWIRNYVITDNYKTIIADNISLQEKNITIWFKDTITKRNINIKTIKNIRSIEEVAETDPNLFLELYETYMVKHKAHYMDVFGKEEFKHILDTKNYNL
jgi:hypothetical protein